MVYSRREALTRLGAFGAVGAVSTASGAWMYGRERRGGSIVEDMPQFAIERSQSYAQMAVARGGTAISNTRAAIAALGGMSTFINAGDRVVIKPNVAWKRIPEQAATTNPDVVAELVRLCRDAGAAEVVVFDSPCDAGVATFRASGIEAAVRAAGGETVFPGKTDYVKVRFNGKLIKEWPIWKELPRFDKIINAAIAKHHVQSRVTCGMKNWYGILGGDRGLLHQDIHGSIVDLAESVRPTLSVLDAQRVLMRNGPTGGSLGDVKEAKAVAASVDPVALDAWGIGELEQRVDDIKFMAMAVERGIGLADWRELRFKEVSGA
jgi:uncharacterized protein (DUF362 family)